MDKQQYEQARVAGQSARNAGRPRDTCPIYALGAAGAMLREAWQDSWDERDAEIKRGKK